MWYDYYMYNPTVSPIIGHYCCGLYEWARSNPKEENVFESYRKEIENTVSSRALEMVRAYCMLDACVRIFAPFILKNSGREPKANELRQLPQIAGSKSAHEALELIKKHDLWSYTLIGIFDAVRKEKMVIVGSYGSFIARKATQSSQVGPNGFAQRAEMIRHAYHLLDKMISISLV